MRFIFIFIFYIDKYIETYIIKYNFISDGFNVNHVDFDDVKKNYLIMIVIIKKGENLNVCMHDFGNVKEESNKVVSKDKRCFKINTRLF